MPLEIECRQLGLTSSSGGCANGIRSRQVQMVLGEIGPTRLVFGSVRMLLVKFVQCEGS